VWPPSRVADIEVRPSGDYVYRAHAEDRRHQAIVGHPAGPQMSPTKRVLLTPPRLITMCQPEKKGRNQHHGPRGNPTRTSTALRTHDRETPHRVRWKLLPYLAPQLTAGLCEEFLYRGFVMAVLVRVGLPSWAVVLISSFPFGLAHSYQWARRRVMTSLSGSFWVQPDGLR